jgi:Ca2+:H+ antiporter
VADDGPKGERRLPPHLEPRGVKWSGRRRIPWSLALLLAIPVSIYLNAQHASSLLVFVTACIGVLPLAGLMGTATEQIAERTGPTVGGLLNATFGNAAELIIAIVALRAGLVDLVKASITGSILGNLLLILGLALIAGGVKSPILRFNRTNAGMGSAMLALAVAGLVFPALFHSVHPGTEPLTLAVTELQLSEAVAIILAVTYGLSLLFSLHTHKTLFGVDPNSTPHGATWSLGKAVLVLGLATAGVVVESEILVHAVEGVTSQLGLSQTFLGLIVIPIIGNAAEHASAVTLAWKGKTDLSIQIALGSSTQVALLVAPLLVLAGLMVGTPLNLVFTPLEVVALGVSTIVVAIITLDGESHWFEGAQLLALYGMVGAAAYFI